MIVTIQHRKILFIVAAQKSVQTFIETFYEYMKHFDTSH